MANCLSSTNNLSRFPSSPCIHRGHVTRTTSGQEKQILPIYECRIHGSCVVQHCSKSNVMASCRGCGERNKSLPHLSSLGPRKSKQTLLISADNSEIKLDNSVSTLQWHPAQLHINAKKILLNQQIKVGYIFPHWNIGGVGRAVLTLILQRPAGIEFSGMAIKTLQSFNTEGQKRSSLPIWYGGDEPRYPRNYPGVNYVSSFQEACQNVINNSDVIILWGFGTPNKVFDRLDWKGKRVVVTTHGCCEYTERLVNTLEQYATDYRAVSKAAAEAWGDKREQVRIVYNGVDLNRIVPLKSREELRSQWGIKPSDIVITHVGRLSYDKNPLAIAKAVKQLDEDYIALYAGDGKDMESITSKVKSILGNRAIFIGAIDHVGNVLAALDCFVMVTPSEGHCNALNEAWGAGVPVVSTRVGAIPELEDRFGQLVVPVTINPSPDALSDAIQTAISCTDHGMIQRAKKMIHNHFTAAHMANSFADHIQNIMQQHVKTATVKRTQPTFSIAITASKPNLLTDAIRHVVHHFPDYKEIVVAASPELPSKSIKLIEAYPRTKIIEGSSTREAAGDALFSAMSACTGEWIVNVDDDDLWLQFDMELVENVSDDTAIISGGAIYLNYDKDWAALTTRQKILYGKSVKSHTELDVKLTDKTATMPGSFRVVRREAWKEIEAIIPRDFLYNDYATLLCLLCYGWKYHPVHEIWGVVRRYNNPSGTKNPGWPEVYRKIIAKLNNKAE